MACFPQHGIWRVPRHLQMLYCEEHRHHQPPVLSSWHPWTHDGLSSLAVSACKCAEIWQQMRDWSPTEQTTHFPQTTQIIHTKLWNLHLGGRLPLNPSPGHWWTGSHFHGDPHPKGSSWQQWSPSQCNYLPDQGQPACPQQQSLTTFTQWVVGKAEMRWEKRTIFVLLLSSFSTVTSCPYICILIHCLWQ